MSGSVTASKRKSSSSGSSNGGKARSNKKGKTDSPRPAKTLTQFLAPAAGAGSDSISFASATAASRVTCPLCNHDLSGCDDAAANAHVNSCLDAPPPVSEKPKVTLQPPVAKSQTPNAATTWANIFKKPEKSAAKAEYYEDAVEAAAAEAESQSDKPAQRTCPFYKRMPNTTFTVDAFCYGKVPECTAYFLTYIAPTPSTIVTALTSICPFSHFHADHYGGLTASFSHGPIYCTPVTRNLIRERIKVADEYLHAVPMNEEVDVQGVKVTFMDANHCPGAAIILFRVPNAGHRHGTYTCHFHTGDFRAHPVMLRHPALAFHTQHAIDHLYLDTTYLKPNYAFPAQELILRLVYQLVKDVVSGKPVVVGRIIKRGGARAQPAPETGVLPRIGGALKQLFGISAQATDAADGDQYDIDDKDDVDELDLVHPADPSGDNDMFEFNPDIHLPDVFTGQPVSARRVLIVVGTYLIGKEKVFLEAARATGSKIYADDYKRRIFECLQDDQLMELYTSKPQEAQVHVVSIRNMNSDYLQNYLGTMKRQYTHLLALKPTGWTFRGPKASEIDDYTPPRVAMSDLVPVYTSPTVCIMGVPYSEHSSFYELSRFVKALNVKRVLPTVNVGSEKSRNDMDRWLREWHEAKRANGGRVISWDDPDYIA
ncbi:DNA cross-link repair protein PSO2/SNM1 [Sorochytrium milnesiophthora]